MKSRLLPALGGAVVVGTLALTGCSSSADAAQDDRTIRFATLPISDDPNAETPVEEIAALLAEETGYEVEITDVPNYSAVIEAIRSGHEDIGIMSAFPTAMGVNTGEVDPLVAWPGDDSPVARCVVLADSPIRTLEDITPDDTVAFADPASSSGYFMPVYMLDRAGLTQGEDYEVLFESPAMPVSLAVLGNQKMSEDKRTALLEALPVVFSAANADALGTYGEALPEGVEPMIEPGPETFQTLVDIAAVAGVDISDLE